MFEKQNKSPKFIITLPLINKQKKVVVQKIEENSEEEKKDVVFADIVNDIPLLMMMNNAKDQKPLKQIDTLADFYEKIDGYYLQNKNKSGKKPWQIYGNQIDVAPNFN